MHKIATLDFEASGISKDSYPIEVGIALPNGKTWCSLILPAKHWTNWSKEAEEIHGITRDELIQFGRHPTEVAIELNRLLKGLTVYSDCWVLDNPWLNTLFHQAAVSKEFDLLDIMYVMDEDTYYHLSDTKQNIADSRKIERHRASNDASILQLAFEKLAS